MAKTKQNRRLVTLPVGRLSYPHLLEAYAFEEGDSKKFMTDFMFGYGDDPVPNLDGLKEAVKAVAKEAGYTAKNPVKPPPEGVESYKVRVTAKSDYRPKIHGANGSVIDPDTLTDDDVYPGRRAVGRVVVAPYAGFGGGVTLYLQGVKLLSEDGVRIGGSYDGSWASEDEPEDGEDF